MLNENYTLFLKAKDLEKLGKYNESIDILKKIALIEPNDRIIKFKLGRILVKVKKFDEAKECFSEFILCEGGGYAQLELGKIEVLKGDITKANAYFSEVLNNLGHVASTRQSLLYELGQIALNIKNYNLAEKSFELLLSETNNYNIIYDLAKINLHKKNLKKAKYYLLKLLDTPNKTIALYELAKLEIQNKNFNEAKIYLLDLLEISNNNYALLNLGKIEATLGNFDLARSYFQQLLNTSSENEAILELGRISMSIGNIENARYYFQKLLNTSSNNSALLDLGKLEFIAGNNNLARMYFKNLLNTTAKNLVILLLGTIESYEGNYQLAKDYLEQLLNTSNCDYAKEHLMYLEMKQKNYVEAYKYFKELCQSPFFSSFEQYDGINFYLKYKLGLLSNIDQKSLPYFKQQIVNYNEENAIEHIKKHLYMNNDKALHSTFCCNINIKELYQEVKKLLTNMQPDSFSNFDRYVITCGRIMGNSKGKETNKIMVLTILNTHDIITMFPVTPENIDKYKISKTYKKS